MTHHWPVRDNLRQRGSASSPHPHSRPSYCNLNPSPYSKTPQHRLHSPTGFQIENRHKEGNNVLRCSGTPRISGKLFTGLSVGRTAALCIIVIQTGRQTHAHTPATRWAHSPSCLLEKKVYDDADVEASLLSVG